MSETPTPPWGIRVEHDVRHDYADATERLQTRLLHIGLFLLTVVMLGGGAGVLTVVTGDSRAVGVSIAVVAGCVVAVLVSLLAAMSATRRLTSLARKPQPVAAPRPAPMPIPRPEPVARPEAAPLWSSRQSDLEVTITDDPGQRREVFVKLARRLQSLINRAIKRIDELEQDNEDPELLNGLYEIDHLFTLARRQGENLAVLGGEAPQRRSNKPVSVYAVLLAAVSEAEHYRQIAIVPVEDVEIHGHAVAEIIHLLAELLENATRFTSPDGPKVEVRAHKVTAGLAIEVQDRGLGMSHGDLERINNLLDGSTRIDLSELLEDGRIGLAVVRELARRHDIRVRLQSNIFGGIAAAVVIPPPLLSEKEPAPRHPAERQQQTAAPALPKRRREPGSMPAIAPAQPAQGVTPSEKEQESQYQAERQQAQSSLPQRRPEPGSMPGITPAGHPAAAQEPTEHHTERQQRQPEPSSLPRITPASQPTAAQEPTEHHTERQQRQPEPSSLPRITPAGRPVPSPQPATVATMEQSRSVPSPAPRTTDPAVATTQPSASVHGHEPTARQPFPEPATARPIAPSQSAFPAEQAPPVQVPAPVPIPSAAPSGLARPPQSNRHHADENTAADVLPPLPVRAPGLSYDNLRSGGVGGISADIVAEQGEEPPPLPQRRGSHLREELLERPTPTRPVPGHNTNLMKTVQAGRENWLAEQDREADTNRGESWPTT
jgi:signal transduction histidine kinase